MESRSSQLTERQKAELLLSLVQGKATLAEVCRKHRLDPREVEEWMKSLLGPDAVLPATTAKAPPAVEQEKSRVAAGQTGPSAPTDSPPRDASGKLLPPSPSSAAPASTEVPIGDARERLASADPADATGGAADPGSSRRLRRRRRKHHRRVHQTASAAKTSRVVADWIWALSPILIGLGIGFAVLFLIWLGYFEPAPPP